jgi:energy-coupling factor transporter transmembrane protein EcfT
MEKQKTGFWKAHPLLKAIAVLVGFFSVFFSMNTPIFADIAYLFYFFYYFVGGLYILGILYGIWVDRRCYLKSFSFCLVLLILVILVFFDNFFSTVYPDWKLNGYIVWSSMRSALFSSCAQMLSVLGGYILSRVISYFVDKYRKERGITD